jgi:GPH family glycoside/pentoside/hexuronide:cation symporter
MELGVLDRLNTSPLTWLQKTAYASPGLALSLVGVPLYVYIPKFYTDVVGAPMAVLGYIIMAARILDGVLDPVVGYLSDSTQSRFGRRRPYMAVASTALAIVVYLLYNPPSVVDPSAAAAWFAACLLGLSVAWTLVDVPWESLGPELTFDYHERTSLFAFRDGMILAGVLFAVSTPTLLSWLFQLPVNADGERTKYFWFALLFAPLVLATSWWCVFMFRERPLEKSGKTMGLLTGLKYTWNNRPFLILLISYTVAGIGANLPATLILYYVEHVLGSQRPELFLILYIVTGIIFLPGWVAVSRRKGKKKTWLTAMALNTGPFIGVFFLGPGDEVIYGVLTFLSGIGFGATVAIPSAMQADVIDYDEMQTGRRREGQYIGIWSIMKKLSSAVGMGLALAILGRAGYVSNAEQSEYVIYMLRILYALAPAICMILSFMIALAYPLDEDKHRAILETIIKSRSEQVARDTAP